MPNDGFINTKRTAQKLQRAYEASPAYSARKFGNAWVYVLLPIPAGMVIMIRRKYLSRFFRMLIYER